MATRKTKTGIVLVLVFAAGYALWALLAPQGGGLSNAGLIGGGQGRAADKVRSDRRDGFKGSDEEQQVTGGR